MKMVMKEDDDEDEGRVMMMMIQESWFSLETIVAGDA